MIIFVLSCPASAEIHDAMESYESKVVMLNKQLADVAVQMSNNQKQFSSERNEFKERLKTAESQVAQLSTERDEEREKFRLQREDLEVAIRQLEQRSSELESELEEARRMKSTSVTAAQQEGQSERDEALQKERNEIMRKVCLK